MPRSTSVLLDDSHTSPPHVRVPMVWPFEDGVELARELVEVVAAHRADVHIAEVIVGFLLDDLASGELPLVIAQVGFIVRAEGNGDDIAR